MPKITVNPVIDIASNQEPSIYYLDEAAAIFNCVGSPEAAIRADRGSLAIDNLTGTVYTKTTNGVNTGWSNVAAGGATPGAPVNSLQYNNAGAFGGVPVAKYDVAGSGRVQFDLDKFQLGTGLGGSIVDDAGFRLLSLSGSGGSPKVNYLDMNNGATGIGLAITATSAVDSNVAVSIVTKGTGLFLQTGGPARFSTNARSGGANRYFVIITPADTNQTASQEIPGIQLGGSAANPALTITREWATGALALQREITITAPTYAFVGASTITTAVTLAITGAPIAGANATITNAYALWVQAGLVQLDGTLSTVGGATFATAGGGINIGGAGSNGSWNPTSIKLRSDLSIVWSSGTNAQSAPDLGLARHAAGVMRVTDSSTGAGQLILGTSSDTAGAQLDVRSQSTSRIGFRVDSLASSTVDLAQFNLNTNQTAVVANNTSFQTASSGTPGNGFGHSISHKLQSSTTANRQAALDQISWVDATDATRKAQYTLSVFDTAIRLCVTMAASGSAPMIGFLGGTAQVQQVSGANLTNNVTVGGSNDVIADFTNLSTYATDAATIRNDIYQLARKLKQVNDALRLYGLLT